ncbi:MAG TPA: glycosyltransferase family 39 protein [Polyangia bacterium]|nr:glycosyltransferase family 39 protein [Polyangia bacterium]
MSARRRGLIALLLFFAGTLVTFQAGRTQGFPRDEGYYFEAGELYAGWYEELLTHPSKALTRASVDRWFGYNHEHPALMKTLFGLSWRLLHRCECPRQAGRHPVAYSHPHRTLSLLSEAEAFRLPADLFAGLLVALVFLFGAQAWSTGVGLVAAVLTLAAPRMFFHAQLACFDAPVVTTWVACVWAYWRALSDRRWGWRAGVAFGLALATKHNGFFLPFVLGAHYLVVTARALRRGERFRFPVVFLWMAGLGPLIELAHWPWLWFDTVARFREYLAFHLHHVYYNMEYLGTNYNKPPFPWSYAFVMTLFTVPVTTLALGLGGAAVLLDDWRRERRGDPSFLPASPFSATCPGLLVGLNALFPLCIIAFTGAPIFGGVKHFLATLPFLALLAGVALDRLVRYSVGVLGGTVRGARMAMAGAGVLVCLPAVAETVRSHPYGLTHYNLLAGGPAGGADLGLNRQYWGYSTRGVLPWLDEHAPRHAAVYWHDTNQPILNMNVREGLLREDIGNTGLEEPGVRASSIAMVIHERHFNKYEYWIWDFFFPSGRTTKPARVLTHEGVPIVTVYERPRP